VSATTVPACGIDACDRPHKARGLCQTHYMRERRHGDPAVSLINRDHADTCSVDGCERRYRADGLCSMHWQRRRARGDMGSAQPSRAQYGPDSRCTANGCERRPQRNWLCEMHADRVESSGDPGPADAVKAPAGSGYTRDDGYIEVRRPGHPLARKDRALLHRIVLWDRIGPGPHPCNWCGRSVDWSYGLTGDVLVADHLDHDTANNDSANLVPSCHPCNSARHRS
jgi:hypothetical protein